MQENTLTGVALHFLLLTQNPKVPVAGPGSVLFFRYQVLTG